VVLEQKEELLSAPKVEEKKSAAPEKKEEAKA
jgi:hypothetical protein